MQGDHESEGTMFSSECSPRLPETPELSFPLPMCAPPTPQDVDVDEDIPSPSSSSDVDERFPSESLRTASQQLQLPPDVHVAPPPSISSLLNNAQAKGCKSSNSFVLDVVKDVDLNEYAAKQSRYSFVGRLGESIYGYVYKAFDNQSRTFVAVKLSVLRVMQVAYHKAQANPLLDVLESPLLEAKIMRRLNCNPHPSVLRFVDEFLSEDSKVHWLVTEYAPNGDLFDFVIKWKTSFLEPQAHRAFAQLALGLQHIHRSGFAHLDFSLENVLLDEHFNVKICDFGVSRPIPPTGRFDGLHVRSKVGYMSAEVLQRETFDARSADVFSLGVVLYGMLFVGHKPFEFASCEQVSYHLISTGRIREYLIRSRTMVPVSEAALDLLSRMLCPEDRRITLEGVLSHPFLKAFLS